MIKIFKDVNDCDFEVRINARREGDLERSVLDTPSSYMQKYYTMEQLLYVGR